MLFFTPCKILTVLYLTNYFSFLFRIITQFRYKPFLERLDVIDSSTIMIFDLHKREHVFIFSTFETVLGYDIDDANKEGTEYFNRLVHTDDLLTLTEAGVYFLEMALKLPTREVRNYKPHRVPAEKSRW